MKHHPRTYFARCIGGALILGALALAGGQDAQGATAKGDYTVAKVYGCPQEDACTIDYRGDANGRGVWVIRRDTTYGLKPKVLAKVYGCDAEDDCYMDYRGDRKGRMVWVITFDVRH